MKWSCGLLRLGVGNKSKLLQSGKSVRVHFPKYCKAQTAGQRILAQPIKRPLIERFKPDDFRTICDCANRQNAFDPISQE